MIEPSPDRVEGPHAGCAGCDWAHFAPAPARAAKRELFLETMQRIGKLDPAGFGELPIAASAPGYRLRTRLHAAGGEPGYFAPGTHRVVSAGGVRSDRSGDPRAAAGDGGGHRLDRRGRVRARDARGPSGSPAPRARDRFGRSGPGGGARPRALRPLPGGPHPRRRREEDARARRPLPRPRGGRPRVRRLGRQLLPGQPVPRVGPLRRRRGRGRRARRRGRRSTPSAAWVSSRARWRRPGTGSSPSRPTPQAVLDARRTKERWKDGERWEIEGPVTLARFLQEDDRRFACVVVDPPRAGLGAELAGELARRSESGLSVRLLRPGDARARSAGDPRRGFPDPRREAVRPLRPDPSGRGAGRPRAGGVIRPVLAEGEAPAARAAVCLVCGIFLGAWSVGGASRRAACSPACRRSPWRSSTASAGGAARSGSRSSRSGWPPGSCSGRTRIAAPADAARASFWRMPASTRQAAVVEGVLTDFWSGQPPRGRTTLRASRLRQDGAWIPFPPRSSCSSRERRPRCRRPIAATACG